MSAESEWTKLDFHWGEAYEIWKDPDRWVAMFRGETWRPALLAETSGELLRLIRKDYFERTLRCPATQKTARPGSRGARAGGLRLVTGDE